MISLIILWCKDSRLF